MSFFYLKIINYCFRLNSIILINWIKKVYSMNNEDLDKLKLDLECEKFRLMSFQLENLLEEYDKLLELRENIQLKFFQAMENIGKNEIPVREDFTRWDEVRTKERKIWMEEINFIADLKYDIDDNLKILDNNKLQRLFIEKEIND